MSQNEIKTGRNTTVIEKSTTVIEKCFLNSVYL